MAGRITGTNPTGRRKRVPRVPWNKGRRIGQKPALKLSEVRAVRRLLKARARLRDRVLFELAIDSKLRGCDLIGLRCGDVELPSGEIRTRTSIQQRKTGRAVRFELSARTRRLLGKWLARPASRKAEWLFPSERTAGHVTVRQYARLVDSWIDGIGLDPALYGTHSLRRTKVAHLYRETRNIRAIQLLLGHSSLEHTVRYLGFEIEDALSLSEKYDL